MSNPKITLAASFTVDDAAPLTQIPTTSGPQPYFRIEPQALGASVILSQDLSYYGLLPMFASWTTSGSVTDELLTLADSEYARIFATTGIFSGGAYRFSIIINGTAPQVKLNGSVVVPTETILLPNTTNDHYLSYNINIITPLLTIDIVGVGAVTIRAPYLYQTDFLYTDTIYDTEPLFYAYEALWHHKPLSSNTVQVIGPYGEMIPRTEYLVQYSSQLLSTYPRGVCCRTWTEQPTSTLTVTRVLFRQRLIDAYDGKPLYLYYNKAEPTLLGYTVKPEYRELISLTGVAVAPWAIRYIKFIDKVVADSHRSGYRLITTRPKIKAIFKPELTSNTKPAYPTSLTAKYWVTKEAFVNNTHKVSWQLAELLDSTTAKVDCIDVVRKPYPDNTVILLTDIDPETGQYYPNNTTSASSATGSLLVCKNDRALPAKAIVGVDGTNGIIKCSDNLDNESVWISYRRTHDWWTFDQPYLTGPYCLARQAINTDTIDTDTIISVYIYPSYSSLLVAETASSSINTLTVASTAIVAGANEILETDMLPLVAYTSDEGTLSDGTYTYIVTATFTQADASSQEVVLGNFASATIALGDDTGSIELTWQDIGAALYSIYKWDTTNYSLLTTTTGTTYTDDGTDIPSGVISTTAVYPYSLAIVDPTTYLTQSYHVLAIKNYGIILDQVAAGLAAKPLALYIDWYTDSTLVYTYANVACTALQYAAGAEPTAPFYSLFYAGDKRHIFTTTALPQSINEYVVTDVNKHGGGILPMTIIPAAILNYLYPEKNNFADIARWFGHQYQADSSLILCVDATWFAAYIERIVVLDTVSTEVATETARQQILTIANKYCTYGTYVELELIYPWTLLRSGYGGHCLAAEYSTGTPRTDVYTEYWYWDTQSDEEQTEETNDDIPLLIVYDGTGELVANSTSTQEAPGIYIISSDVR